MTDDEAALDQADRLAHWPARAERPVVIEIGAGNALPSVRHFSQGIVAHHNGRLARINPREPGVSAAKGLASGGPAAPQALAGRLA